MLGKIKLTNNAEYTLEETELAGYILDKKQLETCIKYEKTYLCDTIKGRQLNKNKVICARYYLTEIGFIRPKCKYEYTINKGLNELKQVEDQKWIFNFEERQTLKITCPTIETKTTKVYPLKGVGEITLPKNCIS